MKALFTDREIKKIRAEADTFITEAEFRNRFPENHMRRVLGVKQIASCGFYTWNDNGVKTFVEGFKA